MKEDYIRELKDISVNWPRWNRKRMKKMTKSVSELWNIKKPKVYSTYEILKVDKEVRKVFEKIMTFFFKFKENYKLQIQKAHKSQP